MNKQLYMVSKYSAMFTAYLADQLITWGNCNINIYDNNPTILHKLNLTTIPYRGIF